MRVRVLLQRCLQKDPKQRLRDIGDARISLEEVLSGAPEGPAALAAAVPAWRRMLPWAAGAVVAIIAAAIASLATWTLKPSPAKPVTRFTITLPPGQRLAGLRYPALALSADGSQLAYVAATQGSDTPQIYVRAMDGIEVKPIAGTEGAVTPFFSPDGKWLGFFADAKLKKISVNGGVAQTLADAGIAGGDWGSQGTIVFSPIAATIQQISDGGGALQPVTTFEKGDGGHVWPEFLPGSKAVIFSVFISKQGIAVQPLGTGGRRNLIQGQAVTMPRYASSGHLIYVQAGNLIAVPLDVEHLQVTGEAVPVVQGVMQTLAQPPAAQYSVSASGSLVYVPGGTQAIQSRLVWVSRNGREEAVAAPARNYEMPRLSPDGRRVAINAADNEGAQIWLYDLARDTLARLTFGGSTNQYPVWTPDGKRIAFMSDKEGLTNIFWQLADGSGGLEHLTVGNTEVPFSWSPDAQQLAFVNASGTPEIWVLRMGDASSGQAGQGRKAQPLYHTGAFEDAPQFSPDGRWLAYTSNESGRTEVYVQPYPGPGGKWLISTDGGTEPQWNRNGRELFYRLGDKMMAVDISTQPNFAAGKPRQLFEGRYASNPLGYARPNYDVSPDGQRFLMLKPVEQQQTGPTQINVVLNWTEELKRLVPTGK